MNNEESRESRAIVTGLGLVCFALFAGVSLYTHSPYDVLDYHAAQSQEIQNKAGLIGAQLAHHAFCLYGVGAWVLVILMLLCGSWICAVRSMSGFLAKAFGSLLLTSLVCTWAAALGDSSPTSESCPAGPGGLWGGTFLAPPLISYFGRVGVYMVLTTVSLLCCLLLAPGLTEFLLGLVGRGVVSSGLWLANWLLGRVQSIPEFVPAQPALAQVNAGANDAGQDAAELGAGANARVAVLPQPATRRGRGLLSGLEDQDQAPVRRFARSPRKDEGDDEAALERFARSPRKDEEEELSEEEEAERRRQEALRQVEAADAARLEREEQARNRPSSNPRLSKSSKRSAPPRRNSAPNNRRNSPPSWPKPQGPIPPPPPPQMGAAQSWPRPPRPQNPSRNCPRNMTCLSTTC